MNIIIPKVPRQIKNLYKSIDFKGSVLDIGCEGFKQVEYCNSLGQIRIDHSGVNYNTLYDIPKDYNIKYCDLNKNPLPFKDSQFDIVFASHIIEHLTNPLACFEECIRVCNPGGFIYIECPSTRSLYCPSINTNKYHSLNFYDDPTHIGRPQNKQSLRKLGLYFLNLDLVEIKYEASFIHRLLAPLTIPLTYIFRSDLFMHCCWQTVGWSIYGIYKKKFNLKNSFRYAR